MNTKPNTRLAVALAMQTDDDSAFALIQRAEAIRSLDARDLVLEAHLREAADLLRCEVWGQERDLPPWTDNVAQPYAECYSTSADGTRTLSNPKASDLRLARATRAKERKTGVLESTVIRPKAVGNLFTLTHEEASELGQMSWLANE